MSKHHFKCQDKHSTNLDLISVSRRCADEVSKFHKIWEWCKRADDRDIRSG